MSHVRNLRIAAGSSVDAAFLALTITLLDPQYYIMRRQPGAYFGAQDTALDYNPPDERGNLCMSNSIQARLFVAFCSRCVEKLP